ncbi:MAG: hypothetical protein ACYSTS_19440 [Planctomycetota bacterium]|jgi:hypothetical protein
MIDTLQSNHLADILKPNRTVEGKTLREIIEEATWTRYGLGYKISEELSVDADSTDGSKK